MKRLSFFMLTLCALFCSSAYAQMPQVSSAPSETAWADDTHWYYIIDAKSHYVGSTSSSTGLVAGQAGSEASQWCLVSDGNGGYKFYNKAIGVGQVIGIDASTKHSSMVDVSNTDKATGFSLVAAQYYNKANNTSDYYCIKWNSTDNTNYYWNLPSTLDFWISDEALYGYKASESSPGNGDECSSFKFEEVVITYDVTYNYQVDGVTFLTTTSSVKENTTVTVPAPDHDFIKLKDPSQTATITAATTINVPCTFTFSVSEDFDNATWYFIKHGKSDSYWHKLPNGNDTIAVDAPDTISLDCSEYGDEYRWCIMGNVKDGYTFYNKAAGNGMSLTRSNDTTSKAYLSTGSTNNTFKLALSQGSTDEPYEGYAFYLPETNVIYLNLQSARIKGYNAADNGSTIRFIEANDFIAPRVLAWAAGYQNYTTATPSSDLPDGAITMYNSYLDVSDNLTAYQSAYNALSSSISQDNVNALIEHNTKVSNGAVGVEEGVYYRLKCASPNINSTSGATNSAYSYLSWDTNDPTAYPATVEEATALTSAASIWQFEKSGTSYILKNVNTGKYIGDISVSSNYRIPLVDKSNAGAINIVQYSDGAGHFSLRNPNYTNDNHHAIFCENQDKDNHRLSVWETGINTASDWYIIKATELDVTLNTVGDASYASLYLPFAVSAPEGTTIYTGKINDEKNLLKMSSQDVAPANTGIVLVNDNSAASVTMNITTTDATVDANDLSGTLLPITSDLSNYLIFSKGNTSGAIGFYTPSSSLTTIRANKAYILASAVSAASGVMKMDFGGEVTDITAVDASAPTTSGAVYDLAGRRVLTPVKGGIYIQNGRKVMK